MIAFAIIVLLASVVALVMFKRGESLRFETTAQSPQILMQANSEVGTKKRWTVVSQSQHNVVFAFQKGPNMLVGLVLIIFFVVPGLVYFILAGKRESLNVMFDVRPDGLSQVQVTSNGYRGKLAGRSLRSALAAGTPAVTAHPYGAPVAATTTAQATQPAAMPIQPATTAPSPNGGSPALLEARTTTAYPAAWYPDPHHAGQQRYFDGLQWTEHRTPIAG